MPTSVFDDSLRDRLAAVRLLVFDVDGVMTDGRAYYDARGMAMKAFSMRDGFGFVMARFAGIDLGVITGNVIEPLKRRLEKFNITRIKGGHFRKSAYFPELLQETGVPAEHAAYIGDDLFDIPVLRQAGVALAPEDAHADVHEVCDAVIPVRGGHGVIRAAVEAILKAKGIWGDVLQRIESDDAGGL
ncbi:MAG: 3-deoxy-D-manno-octulosonate 8-phosphate phosphatase KdsC [Calditrichaeota bacterium]|nr:3-deoxy-D-manno-octulosonate 8-phosphate phosphatase KdsC [Calditrichota bacterium]